MSWGITFIIIVGLMLGLIILGEWVAFALGITGVAGLFFVSNPKAIQSIGQIAWNMTNSFELTAIPLFVFMGEILLRSGLSNIFYRSASKWFGRLPGGLLQTNIISCSIFAAISGSSPATAAAIGSVAVPELNKQGYNKGMTLGSLAGGGALGILIPPSIIMIIYGSIATVSVERLFMAGVIPGLVAAGSFMVYIGIKAVLKPDLFPEKPPRARFIELIKSFPGMLPFFFLILVILGGIYTGYTTPTEAAAIGALLAMILSYMAKGLTKESVISSLKSTVGMTSMILFIIIGANLLTYLVGMAGVSRGLSQWVLDLQPSLYSFMFIMILVYLVLGCLMDGTSMIFMTVPLLMPMITAMGIDLIWFGIVLTILIEIAQITPPVGLNLYVLKGIAGDDVSFNEIVWSVIPYFFLYMLLIVVLMIVPDLATWLPNHMMNR